MKETENGNSKNKNMIDPKRKRIQPIFTLQVKESYNPTEWEILKKEINNLLWSYLPKETTIEQGEMMSSEIYDFIESPKDYFKQRAEETFAEKNGGTKIHISVQQFNYLTHDADEYACAWEVLNKMGVKTEDNKGQPYSLAGRLYELIRMSQPEVYAQSQQSERGEQKIESLIIKDGNMCPVTHQQCDDECCPPGAECNLGISQREIITRQP